MKSRVVVYHANCSDGLTAAWAARGKYGESDTEYVPAQYGEPPPPVKGREVLVVDFSYPRDVMLKMNEDAKTLLVLDHHKTAKEALEGLPFAVFDMDRSGAGLAWDVLHGSARPWLVDYVEDRDLWRFRLPHSKEVNAWISACKRESLEDWDRLASLGVEAAAMKGEAVLAYIDQYVKETAKHARMVEIAGHRVPLVNAAPSSISELVGYLAEKAPFAGGWFQKADGSYSYSLRSRGEGGEDVSAIAKSFGGGGHRNAAGFSLKERPPGW